MFFNIIIFFIILIILTLILQGSKTYKEGFFDFPDQKHNKFIKDSQTKFNELTNTINLTDPALPVSPDSANAFKIALDSVQLNPTSNAYNTDKKTEYTIPNDLPVAFKQSKMCETYGATCSAFDDPAFAASCGISFDKKGLSADGKPHMGGLFVLDSDRQKQIETAQNVLTNGSAPYDPYKVYQPTLGKAKPGTFALNKDQCLVVKEKVDCESKQTFNSPNCAQCYTSQGFSRVDPKTGRLPSKLLLVGQGTVSINTLNPSSNDNVIKLDDTPLSENNPIEVIIPSNAEGTVFQITIRQNRMDTIPYIAGYIQGQTPRGTFKLDLISLIQSDLVTNSKPRISGSMTISGFRCLTIIPGNNQAYINLSCLMPFSFLNMYDGDALMCDNGPIITQASSATFLESDPCFGKANQPGNYKLECLQTRWVELGGTPQGTGYPSDKAKADAIQKDGAGNPLDIDTIVNNLAPKMTAAQLGKDANGTPLSIADWNEISMWATGIPINTPCDGPTKDNGPLSKECLSYLYLNQGVNSHIGSTYTLTPSASASMKGQNSQNTYCQPGTSIDPATSEGLKFGQSLGGINAVKQTYDQINRLANDNTKSNDERAAAVKQCYGVSFDSMYASKNPGPTQVFAVSGPGGQSYKYTKDKSQQVCAEYGAQVATSNQLVEALEKGADWCFTGWVSDSNTPQYPITTSTGPGCGNGRSGIQSWPTSDGKAGVNCYGPKPGIDDYPIGTILPFSQSKWDQ